jgi:hypothetical protein
MGDWWEGPPLEPECYSWLVSKNRFWRFGAVEHKADKSIAYPVDQEVPHGQVTLTFLPGTGFMICVPKMDEDAEVSEAMLLMTAMMIKAQDKSWAKTLVDEVFDRRS